MLEIWKPIEGWEAFYEVSNIGRVRRLEGEQCRVPGGRIMKLTLIKKKNYLVVSLVARNRKQRPYVHALVCAAFHGPRPEPHLHCCHGDGIGTHNVFDNLRWGTPYENKMDQALHGTMPQAENHSRAKLRNHEVLEIFARAKAGEKYGLLASEFGVCHATISHISNERQWTSVTSGATV